MDNRKPRTREIASRTATMPPYTRGTINTIPTRVVNVNAAQI